MTNVSGSAASPKSCIRFSKTDKIGLVGMRNHLQRINAQRLHVDPSRTHLNEVLIGTADPYADVLDYIEGHQEFSGRSIKTDARTTKPYVLGIVTTSPEYFRSNGQGPGEWDPEKLAPWKAAVLKHLNAEFGQNLVSAWIDLDEDTPHIHFVVVPLVQKISKRGTVSDWLSPRKLLGNIDNEKGFKVHQDRLANALKHLGIERGMNGSKAIHERPKDQQIRIAKEQARKQAELNGREIGMNAVIDGHLVPTFDKGGNKTVEFSDTPNQEKKKVILEAILPVFKWVVSFAHKFSSSSDADQKEISQEKSPREIALERAKSGKANPTQIEKGAR